MWASFRKPTSRDLDCWCGKTSALRPLRLWGDSQATDEPAKAEEEGARHKDPESWGVVPGFVDALAISEKRPKE